MKNWFVKCIRYATLALSLIMTGVLFGGALPVRADSFSGGAYTLDDRLSYDSDELEMVWKPYDHLSNMKLNLQNSVVGSETIIDITFDCDILPTVTPQKYRKTISIGVYGPSTAEWVTTFTEEECTKDGKINIVIPHKFSEAGKYTLAVYESDANGNVGAFEPQCIASESFNISAITDESGSRVKNSLSVEKATYKPDVKETITIEYSLEKPGHDYNMFIVKPGDSFYDSYSSRVLDWYSTDGTIDGTAGRKNKKTFDYTFTQKGIYTVYLYDYTESSLIAQTTFTVAPSIDLGVDESKVKNGKIPFSVSFAKNKTHLDLDSSDKIKFTVQLPFNYDECRKDLERALIGKGYDDSSLDYDFDKSTTTNVKINYKPAGSSESVLLKTDYVKGYVKPHNFEFSAKDILKLINDFSHGDTAYAGVVTVEFSYSGAGYLESFKEKVSFSVARSSTKITVTAPVKTVPRAYGESIGFDVESDLGGEIVAQIYKGSKKIRTVKQSCSLDRSKGVAFGNISWDLGNSSNKYVDAGTYKVKIYTQVKLTTINNGKSSSKTVKSKTKTIEFKVAKPTGSLTLSSVATGLNGGEYATYENPLIGISNNVSIGSKIEVKIKNAKGTVIVNDSYTQPAGKYTRWYDLEKLDSNLSLGKYTASITAVIIGGKKVTKNISFKVEKSPKVEISSVSLSTGEGLGTLSFKTSQSSNVTVQVKNSSGKVVATVIDGKYAAGTIKSNFNFGGYAVGSYSVVVSAKNSGGTSTVTKTFSVAKKPTVVKKPTVSGVSVRFTKKNNEDAYKFSCNYTGKGSKIVMEVMWNDAEQIVAVSEYTAQKDSGSAEWTWDGYKSNGFKASAGSYTIRVYAVNSAGKTEFIRQNFTIGEG